MKGVFWLVSFEKLLGMEVISSKARILGEVKGLEINTENWKTTNLHVKLDNEVAVKLGFKKRFRSSKICLPISFVKAVGEVITLNASYDDLSVAAGITECKV